MSRPLAREALIAAPHVLAAPRARESHVAQKPSSRIQVEAFGHTDVGLQRATNEDCFAVLHQLGLFMVADGVGGNAAGEVASRMALDCVREAFESQDMTWPTVAGDEHRAPGARLVNAGLQRAHIRMRGIASRDPAKEGMATTFAAVLMLQDRAVIVHVGDSRVYRLRARSLSQLTEDHSLLNAFVRAGRWDPEDAASFPYPNAITRAVGGDDEKLTADVRFDVPQPGDLYLVCSDGLHGPVDRGTLTAILVQQEDLTRSVARLIEAANTEGGPDNITAVLVRVTQVGTR